MSVSQVEDPTLATDLFMDKAFTMVDSHAGLLFVWDRGDNPNTVIGYDLEMGRQQCISKLKIKNKVDEVTG